MSIDWSAGPPSPSDFFLPSFFWEYFRTITAVALIKQFLFVTGRRRELCLCYPRRVYLLALHYLHTRSREYGWKIFSNPSFYHKKSFFPVISGQCFLVPPILVNRWPGHCLWLMQQHFFLPAGTPNFESTSTAMTFIQDGWRYGKRLGHYGCGQPGWVEVGNSSHKSP